MAFYKEDYKESIFLFGGEETIKKFFNPGDICKVSCPERLDYYTLGEDYKLYRISKFKAKCLLIKQKLDKIIKNII